MEKIIAVLGATGSVGRQAIDVARHRGYKVDLLSARSSVNETEALVRELAPRAVAMSDERAAAELKRAIADTDTRVYCGSEGICDAIADSSASVASLSPG